MLGGGSGVHSSRWRLVQLGPGAVPTMNPLAASLVETLFGKDAAAARQRTETTASDALSQETTTTNTTTTTSNKRTRSALDEGDAPSLVTHRHAVRGLAACAPQREETQMREFFPSIVRTRLPLHSTDTMAGAVQHGELTMLSHRYPAAVASGVPALSSTQPTVLHHRLKRRITAPY